MTWSPTEQKIVSKQSETLEEIKTALIGNLKTREPGLIDDVREMGTAVNQHTELFKVNIKQHLWLLLGITVCTIGLIYGLLGGTFAELLSLVLK